ncbi:acetoacetate ligase [Fusarium mexicanum]|uniref:Acetoacetate ligase n=1 Tax=Fusarium mexicanum TaxID=751941 RepID=A0A8H5JL43_9HYPO|nr:acetoacetate ligase [Fusarium mexicanum]
MTSWVHPSPQLTQLDAFRRHVNMKYSLDLAGYEQLQKWSVDNTEPFYREIWDFCGFVYSEPPTNIVSNSSTMWPRPEWFTGARLNFTENLLAVGLAAHPNKIAVSACREGGTEWRHLTWKQLEQHVAQYASALRHAGIKAGDRVAAIMTNSIEAVLVLLACGSLGAIFSSASPEMGSQGILERYTQSRPKLLFAESRILYGGKSRDLRRKLETVVKELREHVVELDNVIISGPAWEDNNLVSLEKFLSVPFEPLRFEQVPFDYPVYILYSSGTTGPPKCICHSGGGALLKHKIDLVLGMDLGLHSTYYQYTTTGWMMWNVLVGALSVGSKIVLYDGSPLHPTSSDQLRFLEEQSITHWGTSPKFLGTLMRNLRHPPSQVLSLQAVLVSGSALSAEICDWFYTVFPQEVGLFNGSGGTDMLGCIIGATVLSHIRGNELATATLGMKVEIWDQAGHNIEESGQEGELVITKPFPSMPVTFWGKGGTEMYRKAYFDTFPGVWTHGDFVSRTNTKGYLIHGRSDGVLNPNGKNFHPFPHLTTRKVNNNLQGVRFGTAELYGVLDKFSEVDDCIAVGHRRHQDGDEEVLLFIKMRDKGVLQEPLLSKIRDAIRTMLSPRHVPAHILPVEDIPYTMSGKKVENALRSIMLRENVKNTSAIR